MKNSIILYCLIYFFSAFSMDNFWFSEKSLKNFNLTKEKIIFTFDDGPTNYTQDILKVLSDYKVKATFFLIGNKLTKVKNKTLLQEISDQGHLIANHSFEHKKIFSSVVKLKNSLLRTHELLLPYLTFDNYFFFRSPYGHWNEWKKNSLNYDMEKLSKDERFKNFIGPISWNVGGQIIQNEEVLIDAADWDCWKRQWSVEKCAEGYLKKIAINFEKDEASIILMHETSLQSVQLLDLILFKLQQSNLDLEAITFSEIPNLDVYAN